MDRIGIKTRPKSLFDNFLIYFGILLIFVLQACSHTDSGGSSGDAGDCKPVLEAQMDNILSGVDTDTDFTLYLETEAGQNYTFNYGNSTITTIYESASTSKWVTATIILRLVDEGILSVDDRPQDLIENWPIDSSDPLYDITLADLLSFTSGLTQEPLCINLAGANFEACVNQIGATNAGNEIIPGTQFYYSGTHMQVAGLMAVKAAGVDSWQNLFEMFQLQTGLFPNGAYDLPSATNPRLAGGMHWRGDEYADFIRAFIQGDLLTEQTQANMLADHTASAVMGYSPAIENFDVQWHYGFGIWLQCPSETFDCDEINYYSSPGAYGAYPFFNTQQRYFGILARQGALGTFSEGLAVFEAVVDLAERWAVAPNSCR